ncbi:MAG: hypothetical protein ACPG77_08025 [Nannocystaceae bacterium]
MSGSTKAMQTTGAGRNQIGELLLRLRGEALLRLAPGCRIVDLGHGEPDIALWLDEVCESIDIIKRSQLFSGDKIAVDLPSASYDLTYCIRTLPHLGKDKKSSDRAVRAMLEEVARLTVPGGTAVVEVDNPHSLRGGALGIRQTFRGFTRGRIVIEHEGRSVDRFDALSNVIDMLPPTLKLMSIQGLRVLLPTSHLATLPLVGKVLCRLEWWAREHPLLRRFGAHLLLVLHRVRDVDVPQLRRS